MQKIKIKTMHLKTPTTEVCLEYYLVLKGGLCGIEIRNAHSKERAMRMIPDSIERVHMFLLKLARGRLFPVNLNDVTDDYIYKNWSSQRRFELLRAGADARLNRGERQRKKCGDLRACVSTDKG